MSEAEAGEVVLTQEQKREARRLARIAATERYKKNDKAIAERQARERADKYRPVSERAAELDPIIPGERMERVAAVEAELVRDVDAILSTPQMQATAIRAYLEALAFGGPNKSRRTRAVIDVELAQLQEALDADPDVMSRLRRVQRRLELLAERATALPSMDELAAEFAIHAAPYAERHGITYRAWREMGVPAYVLKVAGIKPSRVLTTEPDGVVTKKRQRGAGSAEKELTGVGYLADAGRRLRARRKEMGMAQVDMALRMKIGQAELSRYERGTGRPSIERAHMLAEVLGLTIEDIWPPDPIEDQHWRRWNGGRANQPPEPT
jgi:DNA-binding XRE family transcriptional regulator